MLREAISGTFKHQIRIWSESQWSDNPRHLNLRKRIKNKTRAINREVGSSGYKGEIHPHETRVRQNKMDGQVLSSTWIQWVRSLCLYSGVAFFIFLFFGSWIFPVLFMIIYFLGVLLFLYSGLVSMSLYFALHGACTKSLLRFLFYIFLRWMSFLSRGSGLRRCVLTWIRKIINRWSCVTMWEGS